MKYFLHLSILFITLSSYGQDHTSAISKVRIAVKTDSVVFMQNGMAMSTPCKITETDPSWIYIARRKGYVNEGFTFKELVSKGVREYTIELKKIKSLPAGYTSKMIEAYKMVDKTGRTIKLDMSDPFFIAALSDKLIAYGYKNVTSTDLFDTKQKESQLKLVGEITQFCQNTIGPAFQISIIVNWSIYDVVQEKIVFQYSSAGYSNTESLFKKELSLALKNALTGLLSNNEFQQLAKLNE